MTRPGMIYSIGIWFFVLAAITAMYIWKKSHTPAVYVSPPVPMTPVQLKLDDFEFLERSGRRFRFDELKGEVWVASFFFSNCPGPCRLLNTQLAELQKQTADLPVKVLSFSVDPANDTPERLQTYAAQFAADADRWLFLTGSPSEVQRLAREQFLVTAGTTGNDPVTHTERIVAVDAQGRMRGHFSVNTTADIQDLVRQLKQLIEEKP